MLMGKHLAGIEGKKKLGRVAFELISCVDDELRSSHDRLPFFQPNRYLILPWLVWNTAGVVLIQIVCLAIVSQHHELDVSSKYWRG